MLGINPDIVELKLPDVAPSVVLLPVMVGLGAVPQTTPDTVIGLPPSYVIAPPETAPVVEMDDTAVVVSMAKSTTEIRTIAVEDP